jgi:hypothetical protein
MLLNGIRDALVRRADGELDHPDVRLWRVLIRRGVERHAVLFGAVPGSLEIHPQGTWFRRNHGAMVDCGHRPVLRRLVAALARARIELPGQAVPVESLILALWPGEKIRVASARRRLQVAISRLRELGLSGVIVHAADGYLLAPTSDVVLSPEG